MPWAPDTNFMIPARMTGKPFWEIFYYKNPSLWKAYNECVQYFGIDGFSHHGICDIPPNPNTETKDEIINQTEERIVVHPTHSNVQGRVN